MVAMSKPESQTPPNGGDTRRALALALLIVAVTAAYHSFWISAGGVNNYDEFLTLERATSFLRHHDWLTVYSENLPSFKKPPLQYWMSAWFLDKGLDLTVALRLPSMLFAVAALCAVILLARAVLPANPWAMPAAALIYASSSKFWEYATSAMLDTGAAFFATLAIAATILALRRSGWWYVVALTIGLGALQKAPIGLALVFLFLVFLGLTSPWHPYGFGTFLRNRHFHRSAFLALALLLAWPLIQLANHGVGAFNEAYVEQMFDRFAPSADEGVQRSVMRVLSHLLGNENVLRGLGVIALFVLPWRLRRFDLLPFPMIIVAYFLAVLFAGGHISHRYPMIFIPYFAMAIAGFVVTLGYAPRKRLYALLAISVLSGGPFKVPAQLDLYQDETDKAQIAMLSDLGEALQPSETLVMCTWDRDTRLPRGLVTHYASNGRPYVALTKFYRLEQMKADGEISGLLRGICTEEELEQIEGVLDGLEIVTRAGGYVQWTGRIGPSG